MYGLYALADGRARKLDLICDSQSECSCSEEDSDDLTNEGHRVVCGSVVVRYVCL
jgi:hypothetical protein